MNDAKSMYKYRRLMSSDIFQARALLRDHARAYMAFGDLMKYSISTSHDAFVAICGTDIIGIIAGHDADSETELDILCVDEKYRRQGIAHELLQMFLRKKDPVLTLSLDVRVSNTTAQKIYERWGFIRTGGKPRYYSNEDSYTMVMENRSSTISG